MTTSTPGAPPTVALTFDAASYAPGAVVTATVVYADSQTETFTVTVTASATDSFGQTASSVSSFTVVTTAPESMTASLSDDHSGTWVQASDNGLGTVTFTAPAPSA